MNEISVNRHEKAEELRQGILTSFTLVQKNLWDLCMKLKEMRDTKLYKELGYGEFNDFTTAEIRMSDRNVYRYIAIAEKVNPDLVTSMSLNMTKLSLLAELSTEQQSEIAENIDLESTTVRELREEVNKLKGMKMRFENLQAKLERERDEAAAKLAAEAARSKEIEKKLTEENDINEGLRQELERADQSLIEARDENIKLAGENRELRERPVEVAVVDQTEEYERKLTEAIETERRKIDEELRSREKDHDDEIKKLREEYEAKMKAAAVTAEAPDKGKQEFKIFLVMAHDALERLIAAANGKDDIYKAKIRELLKAAEQKL